MVALNMSLRWFRRIVVSLPFGRRRFLLLMVVLRIDKVTKRESKSRRMVGVVVSVAQEVVPRSILVNPLSVRWSRMKPLILALSTWEAGVIMVALVVAMALSSETCILRLGTASRTRSGAALENNLPSGRLMT